MARSQRSSSLRASTPPAINTVQVSKFLRGEIYTLTQPTTVMSHGEELGTWYPRGQGLTAAYFSSTPDVLRGVSASPTLSSNVMAASSSTATEMLDAATRIEQAVTQLTTYLTKKEDPKSNG